jgi:hypothetical protein
MIDVDSTFPGSIVVTTEIALFRNLDTDSWVRDLKRQHPVILQHQLLIFLGQTYKDFSLCLFGTAVGWIRTNAITIIQHHQRFTL